MAFLCADPASAGLGTSNSLKHFCRLFEIYTLMNSSSLTRRATHVCSATYCSVDGQTVPSYADPDSDGVGSFQVFQFDIVCSAHTFCDISVRERSDCSSKYPSSFGGCQYSRASSEVCYLIKFFQFDKVCEAHTLCDISLCERSDCSVQVPAFIRRASVKRTPLRYLQQPLPGVALLS